MDIYTRVYVYSDPSSIVAHQDRTRRGVNKKKGVCMCTQVVLSWLYPDGRGVSKSRILIEMHSASGGGGCTLFL